MIKKVTIKDIAKALNTNYSTVSRALNGNPRISEETKNAILEQAKIMGYQPNSLAQQLKKGYSNTIGLIVPRINRVFFSNVIHGVETIAKQKGFNVIICQSNESKIEESNSVQTLLANNVAGIIMSISRESNDKDSFKAILEREIPFVMFDRTLQEIGCNEVVNDNFLGAYQATKHLIEEGYQNIAHFSGPLFLKVYQERLAGYTQALIDNNLKFDNNLIIEDTLTREKGFDAAKFLYESDLKFDAIFAAGDFSALGALFYFKEKGINVPQEIGIVGFANEPFTELIELSSVEQFSSEIGKNAAKLLLEQIVNQDKEEAVLTNRSIKITPELIKRKSTNKTL